MRSVGCYSVCVVLIMYVFVMWLPLSLCVSVHACAFVCCVYVCVCLCVLCVRVCVCVRAYVLVLTSVDIREKTVHFVILTLSRGSHVCSFCQQ